MLNVKNGHGFIKRNDVSERIFAHQIVITRNNPQKLKGSLGKRETVEFCIMEIANGHFLL